MKMYVANLTRQRVEFAYRVRGSTGVRTQNIGIGQQIKISGDLDMGDIEYIVGQHRKYGMIESKEIKNQRNYTGLAYSVDTPVAAKGIEMALHTNTVVLLDRGKENRQRVALAANKRLEENLLESGIPGNLDHMDVTIVEEEHRKPTGEEGPAVGEALRIARTQDQAPQGRGRGRGGRRAVG